MGCRWSEVQILSPRPISGNVKHLSRAYYEEIEVRRREARAQLFEQVNAIIKVIAEAESFDLIVQQAEYGNPQIDITERVLAELAKQPAATRK